MYLHEIPRLSVFLESRTKLVRHRGDKWDLGLLKENGQLETYQQYQHKPVFHECDYLISFMGERDGDSRFLGVYENKGFLGPDHFSPPQGFLFPEMFSKNVPVWQYELHKLDGFEDLVDRLVIKWGKAHLSWHQWFSDKPNKAKEISEISPDGFVSKFPGYEDFILSFDELKMIIDNPSSNREWYTLLRSVAGIYLITDRKDGRQYVGSAYGENGIWGRWTTYSQTGGHGNNKLLKEICNKDPGVPSRFQFTLLRTLPLTMASKEVIHMESLYKRKLGTRAHGLNSSEIQR